MKRQMFVLCALLVSGVGSAQADWHRRPQGCLADEWIERGSSAEYAAECAVAVAPEIRSTRRSYPLLKGNPYKVRYWHGEVTKAVTTTTNYIHVVTNRCTGREVLREPDVVVDNDVIVFHIANPNLSDTVKTAIDLTPMTDAEAQVAFQQTQEACANYRGDNIE